jgi:AcrR family transcriptional regulator
MTRRPNVRKVKAAATRAALVAAARQLFTIKGYHATGTNDLVALAGVTRGALYHHFRDKEALFEAVFREVSAALSHAAGDAAVPFAADPRRRMLEGIQAYLRLVAERPEAQRILLLDGPVVFGWARWREVQSETSFNELARGLRALMQMGLMAEGGAGPLAQLILAALYDAALAIANARDPEVARAEADAALSRLVQGLYRDDSNANDGG